MRVLLFFHSKRIHFSFLLPRNIVVYCDTVKMQSRIALLLIIGIISCNAFPGKYRLTLSIFRTFHFFHCIVFQFRTPAEIHVSTDSDRPLLPRQNYTRFIQSIQWTQSFKPTHRHSEKFHLITTLLNAYVVSSHRHIINSSIIQMYMYTNHHLYTSGDSSGTTILHIPVFLWKLW